MRVQEHGQSQSGSPKVKADGKWYFLNKSLDYPPVNSNIEIKEGSFTMGNKTFPTIEAWRPAGGNGAQAPQHHAQAPAAPPAGDYIDEAHMRFGSNVVASAIEAGIIKEPGQILQWFQGAIAAAKGKPADSPFDDRIPF